MTDFDPDQLIGPDDVLLGVAPLSFTGGDATGFQPGEDRIGTPGEMLAEIKRLQGEVKRLRYDALLGGDPTDPVLFVTDPDEIEGYDTYRVVNADGDVVRTFVVKDGLEVGDRYHTIGELYEHRRKLTAVLATIGAVNGDSWRSKRHHPEDGPMFDGSFIVGIELPAGPISYHYPLSSWDEFAAVREVEHAPKWDGAGPADTLDRLDDFTAHLKAAIDSGREVQEQAREAADAVVEAAEAQTVIHVPGGGCCTTVVAAEEEEDVRP